MFLVSIGIIDNTVIFSYHLCRIYWFFKHWFYQNWQPVAEDEVSDEESSKRSPHQPQQVEGVQTGPLRHTGLVPFYYFHFLIDGKLYSMHLASCVGKIHSGNKYIVWLHRIVAGTPERPQVYFNILQPHPHPPPDHQTSDIEAQRHCGQGGQGPGPGGGGHQFYLVQPGGHWLGVPVVTTR